MTQVSWKKPLLLAVTLVVLGSFATWLEYKHKPETEAKEAESKKIFDLKDTSIQSISIASGGGDRHFALTCEDYAAKLCKPGDSSKWDLVEPIKLRGDDSNVNSLVSSLNSTESSDTIDLKDETPEKRAALLKDYGLDPASRATARRIDLKTSKGEVVAYFGATHPIGEGIFTAIEHVKAGASPSGAIDDSRVLLTPSYFKNNFDHNLTYWRDKKIVDDLHATDIASFKLDSAKSGKLSGERKDGDWSVAGGGTDAYPGDNESIEALLNGVSFLNAKDFASEDKSDASALAALKGTKTILTMTLQKRATPAPAPSPSGTPATAAEPPAPITIAFFAKSDGTKTPPKLPNSPKDKKATPAISKLYVTVSDKAPLYEVDVYAKDRFEKGLKDLRMSKLLTSLERFAAKRIELSGQPIGATPIVLTMADGKWSYSPSKKAADSNTVQTLLDKLGSSKIREFMEGSAIPTGQDAGLKIAIGDEKTPDKKQLLLWKADGKLYSRDLTSGRKEAGQLDLAAADAFPFDATKSAKFFDPGAAPPPVAAPNVHTGAGMPPGFNAMMKGLPAGHPPVGTPPGQKHQ